MATVHFTANLQRHIAAPPASVDASDVGAALEAAFARTPGLRSYLLDDQGHVRHHICIFVDGEQIHDRRGLTDPVRPDSEIWVMQALSGG